MNLRKFISGVSALAIAASAFAGMAVTASADTKTTVGAENNSTAFWGDHSDEVAITNGQQAVFTFTNYTAATTSSDAYKNWLACIKSGDGTKEYGVFRADAYGWSTYGKWNTNDAGHATTKSKNYANVYSNMNGAAVTVTFTYVGTTITIRADWNKQYEIMTIPDVNETTLRAWLTVENAHLTDVTYNTATSVFERGYSTAWTDADLTSWTGDTGSVSNDGVLGLKLSGTKSTEPSKSMEGISIHENAIVNLDMVYNTGTSYGNDNWTVFKLGDSISINASSQNQAANLTVGETEKAISNACVKNKNRDSDTWYVNMVIDTANNVIKRVTIMGTNGDIAWLSEKDIPLPANYDLDSLTLATIKANNGYVIGNNAIKSILITEIEQQVSTVDYTVNYLDANNEAIKPAETRSGVVGSPVAALDTDKADIISNGTKYTYNTVSSTPGITLGATAASNVINLKFDAHAADTLTVNYVLNKGEAEEKTLTSATENGYVDDTVAHYYPKYVKVDNKWYETTESSFKTDDVTLTSGTDSVKVGYQLATTDVVYFEDINYQAGNASLSGGSATSFNDTKNYTVDSGYYKVTISIASKAGGGSGHRGQHVELNNVQKGNLLNSNGIKTVGVVVTEDGSTISVKGNGTSNYTDNIDYILIEKVDEPAGLTGVFEAVDLTPESGSEFVQGGESNQVTKDGKSVFGYKADVEGDGIFTYSVNAHLVSAETESTKDKTNIMTITGTSPAVFYVLTDEAINTQTSTITGVAK